LCGDRDHRQERPFHLTHGLAVWLCATHRSDRYIRRDRGREFVRRLGEAWAAAGCLNARRISALTAHVRRVAPTSDRPLPGSYSWPRARAEAERRYAAGEDPRAVIADLRRRYSDGDASPPSVRTMRRWHTQARWLRRTTNDAPAPARRRGPAPTRTPPGGIRAVQARLPEPFDRWPFWPWGWWPIE
jgi:hypothetical protein